MVTLANINSPTQIVVSGEEDGVVKLMELAEGAGASRVVKLQVAAAFHSELMKPVQDQMAEAVRDVAWSDPRVPVASNSRGALVNDARVAPGRARRADRQPRALGRVRAGAGRRRRGQFLETGPGRVLGGLVRQIHPEANVFSADSPARLDEYVAEQS